VRISATSTGTLAGVAAELERAAVRAQKDAARLVGREASKMILDDVRRSKGSLRGAFGVRLGVKSDVQATNVTSSVELRAKPAGPWAMVESGTKSHTIKPRKKKVLAVGKDDVIGMHAHVRGVRGGRYWTHATDRLSQQLDPIVQRAVDADMGA